jgi:drug/metabolite transporter (DMT)-like permease
VDYTTSHAHSAEAAPPARRLRGEGILIGLCVFWGTSFLIIKHVERSISAGSLVFLRFTLAALLLSPFLRKGRAIWWNGLELGFWLWAGFLAQAIGLRYTGSGRAAFVTSLNVIFVPMLAALAGRRIGGIVWAAAAMAFVGAGLLCYDGSPANVGDLWVLACALLFAVYIVRLETAAERFPALPLTAVQLWTVAALSFPWFARDALAAGAAGNAPHVPWLGVVYLGVVCTAVTTWLQTVGQQDVPAAQASIIYMLEPVFATLFAWVFVGERPGPKGWAGSGLILGATLLSQVPLLMRKRSAGQTTTT